MDEWIKKKMWTMHTVECSWSIKQMNMKDILLNEISQAQKYHMISQTWNLKCCSHTSRE
jgi:hypothetical protein